MASFDLDDPVREALSEAYSASGLGPTVTIDEVTGVTSLGTKKNPTVKDWRDSYKNYINGGGSAISAPDKMSTSKFYSHSLFDGSGASYYSSPRVSQGLMADIQTTIGSGSPTTATATDAGAGTTSAASYAPRAYRRYMQESSGDVYGGGPSTGAPEGPGSTISEDSIRGVTLGTHDRPTSVLADIPFTMQDTQTIGKQGTFREGDFLNVPTAAEIMANPDLYGEMTREEAEQIDRRTVNEFAEDYMSIVLGNKTGEMTIGQQIKALQDQDFSPQDIAKKMASMGFTSLAKALVGVTSPTPFDPFIGEIISEILFGTGKSQHGRVGVRDGSELDTRTGKRLDGTPYTGDVLSAIAGYNPWTGDAIDNEGYTILIDGMVVNKGIPWGKGEIGDYIRSQSRKATPEGDLIRALGIMGENTFRGKSPYSGITVNTMSNFQNAALKGLLSPESLKNNKNLNALVISPFGKKMNINQLGLNISAITPAGDPMGQTKLGTPSFYGLGVEDDQRSVPYSPPDINTADYSRTDYTSSDVSSPFSGTPGSEGIGAAPGSDVGAGSSGPSGTPGSGGIGGAPGSDVGAGSSGPSGTPGSEGIGGAPGSDVGAGSGGSDGGDSSGGDGPGHSGGIGSY